jgi:hypothetical protein
MPNATVLCEWFENAPRGHFVGRNQTLCKPALHNVFVLIPLTTVSRLHAENRWLALRNQVSQFSHVSTSEFWF